MTGILLKLDTRDSKYLFLGIAEIRKSPYLCTRKQRVVSNHVNPVVFMRLGHKGHQFFYYI